MSEPVTVSVKLDDLRELIVAAQECADDLQTEIEMRYASRHEQLGQAGRFERDMAIVRRAEAAIKAVDMRLHEPVYAYK